ncbi:MAG: UvrD-helicase domain-containing protein [bacterium]|nr:UvrD-helicase domain-containing protein [bacterium]
MSKLLDALNPEQRHAVETTEGPVLVLAGAGTGKTRVITYRIAHLLAKKVEPEAVLAVTFTNKAANEMRERIAKLVGQKRSEGLTIGTFHAFCLELLRTHKKTLGWPQGFTICDSSDQLAILKSALRELHIAESRIKPNVLQGKISLLKSRGLTPEQVLARPGDDLDELVARAWQRYQGVLDRSRRVDFDDLLLKAVALLRDNARIRKLYRDRYRYVLVDEYQDTNAPQYDLLVQIAGEHKNLCVVGDDDQSIYGWRGADVSKILGYDRDWPGAETVRLETNYRSTESILGAANRLIAKNPKRHDKSLRSTAGLGDPVQVIMMRDEDYEAEYIVREIKQLVEAGAHYDDFAILFRSAIQARTFEAELRMKEVPYVLVGGMSFFDRKEVRDVMAYLRVIANPLDESSLLRIVNCPPRGVGKTTIDRVLAFATEHGISAGEAFDRADEIEKIKREAVDAVQRLRERLEALGKKFKPGKELVALIERLLKEVAYRGEVDRLYPDEQTREQRWAGVVEVLNFAENYVRKRKRPTLSGFLNNLSLTADDSRDEPGEKRLAVTLMTLHASKGLEFPRVYLVGMEEGLLPHARAVADGSIEEERRLGYVGVTRAQRNLQLTWCNERAKFGTRVQCHLSRFLLEMQGKEPPAGWIPAEMTPEERQKMTRKKRRRRTARR